MLNIRFTCAAQSNSDSEVDMMSMQFPEWSTLCFNGLYVWSHCELTILDVTYGNHYYCLFFVRHSLLLCNWSSTSRRIQSRRNIDDTDLFQRRRRFTHGSIRGRLPSGVGSQPLNFEFLCRNTTVSYPRIQHTQEETHRIERLHIDQSRWYDGLVQGSYVSEESCV